MKPAPQILVAVLSLLGMGGLLWAQFSPKKAAEGEFPAIATLPPGTVIEGIKLPRYEGARVTALILADQLRVESRNVVSIIGLETEVYDKDGSITSVKADKGSYSFLTEEVTSEGITQLVNQQFRAKGCQIYYSTKQQRGIMRGPVRTVLSSPNSSNTTNKPQGL